MSFEGENREKSEFNMAVSYLNRINVLLSSCDQASISLDVYSWYHSLLATMRELSTWMNEDEIKEFNKLIKEINPAITKIYKKVSTTGRMEIPHDVYMKLHNMELNLRSVAKKSGLLMKIADSAYDALK